MCGVAVEVLSLSALRTWWRYGVAGRGQIHVFSVHARVMVAQQRSCVVGGFLSIRTEPHGVFGYYISNSL
jgi:hypothetical protein